MPDNDYNTPHWTRKCLGDIRDKISHLNEQYAALNTSLAHIERKVDENSKDHKEERRILHERISATRKDINDLKNRFVGHDSAQSSKSKSGKVWFDRLFTFGMVLLTAFLTWLISSLTILP